MRRPAPGKASPWKSWSRPAMIRSSVDFPLPLAPITPILAPRKKLSQMPRRISRLGGTTLRRSFITKAYSPAMAVRLPSAPPDEPAVLGHHAAVLDDLDPRAGQGLGGPVVA